MKAIVGLKWVWVLKTIPQMPKKLDQQMVELRPTMDFKSSWADYAKKKPQGVEGKGAQNHLSKEEQWWRWILRMFWTIEGSSRSCNKWLFQICSPGIKSSATEKIGKCTRLTLGIGLKWGIKGIQISTFKPLEIEIKAPFSTTILFF
jgi:hypothetical protein